MAPHAISSIRQLSKVRLACVPEHFSAPFYMYPNLFQQNSIDLEIISAPSGTGDMLRKLERAEVDIGTTLMEGTVLKAVHDIFEQKLNPVKISGLYTSSKLCWSIAIHPKSTLSLSQLEGKRVGISRFGSGSHIMSVVLALQHKFKTPFEFVVCNDINGLVKSINDQSIDFFLWERITTQPYYEAQSLKMLDTITSPWPAFVFSTVKPLHSQFLAAVKEATTTFVTEFTDKGKDFIYNSKVFHYPRKSDIQTWFDGVQYSDLLEKNDVQFCIDTLVNAGLIDSQRLASWERDNGSIVDSICEIKGTL